jgi:hypothetical protein
MSLVTMVVADEFSLRPRSVVLTTVAASNSPSSERMSWVCIGGVSLRPNATVDQAQRANTVAEGLQRPNGR